MLTIIEYKMNNSGYDDFGKYHEQIDKQYFVSESQQEALEFAARQEIENPYNRFRLVAIHQAELSPGAVVNIYNSIKDDEQAEFVLYTLVKRYLEDREYCFEQLDKLRLCINRVGLDNLVNEIKQEKIEDKEIWEANIKAKEELVIKVYPGLTEYWKNKVNKQFGGLPDRLVEKAKVENANS